jgi:halogenation protein CepH
VLAGTVAEPAAFGEFEARYRREFSVFYEYLMSFYDMHVSEQSYFWTAKKVTASKRPELESFVELVGGLASGEQALTSAEEVITRFKSSSGDFASAVDKMVAGGEQSMLPILQAPVVFEVMREGAQVQSQALFGLDAEPEIPLFDGGLIASPDGMSWSAPRS